MKTPTLRQVLWFLAFAMVGVVIATVLLALVIAATKSTQIRDTQEQRASQIQSNDRTLRIIRGCTTPGKPCYERAKRATARAVGDVNRVVILAASCASGAEVRTVAEIQACVIERLAEQHHGD